MRDTAETRERDNNRFSPESPGEKGLVSTINENCNFMRVSLRTFSSSSTIVNLPPFIRINDIALALKLKKNVVLKEIAFRHRRSFFYFYEKANFWFQFKSANDIIIPYEYAKKYAEKKGFHVKPLNFESKLIYRNKATGQSVTNDPVVLLLGHFNHGKTTLIDTLGGTQLVDKEEHGITQEIRTISLPIVIEQDGSQYRCLLISNTCKFYFLF